MRARNTQEVGCGLRGHDLVLWNEDHGLAFSHSDDNISEDLVDGGWDLHPLVVGTN